MKATLLNGKEVNVFLLKGRLAYKDGEEIYKWNGDEWVLFKVVK